MNLKKNNRSKYFNQLSNSTKKRLNKSKKKLDSKYNGVKYSSIGDSNFRRHVKMLSKGVGIVLFLYNTMQCVNDNSSKISFYHQLEKYDEVCLKNNNANSIDSILTNEEFECFNDDSYFAHKEFSSTYELEDYI